MKFHVELSDSDLIHQKRFLEDVCKVQSNDRAITDKREVQQCLAIFKRTFKKELCPSCRIAELEANHLSAMYNVITKRCPHCNYVCATSLKQGKQF